MKNLLIIIINIIRIDPEAKIDLDKPRDGEKTAASIIITIIMMMNLFSIHHHFKQIYIDIKPASFNGQTHSENDDE